MASAPSVRRQRRELIKAERRDARGGRPAPIIYALIGIAIIGAVLLGALALRAWLTDPLARGREALAEGNARAASIDLRAAASAAPDDPTIRLDLARAYNLMGQAGEANRQLDRAAELGLPVNQMRTERAQAALASGDARKAVQMLVAGAVPVTETVRALTILADAQYRIGDYRSASASYQRALRTAPNDEKLWTRYARYRLAEQDMLGAQAAADRAVALAPNSATALAVKADVERARGGPVTALPLYEAALAQNPDDVAILGEYAASLGDAGRTQDAEASLAHAAQLQPDNPRILFLRATLAARAGEMQDARALLRQIGGADADIPSVLVLRTAVELALDAPRDAAIYASRLVRQQPDNRLARRLWALALMQHDNIRGTITVLDPITTQPDADSWSLLLLSRAMGGLDWQNDSIQPLTRATSLQPGDAAALAVPQATGNANDPSVIIPNIRAQLAAGNGAGAQVLANQLAAMNPGVPQAAMLQGDAAMVSNNLSGAITYYRRAAELRFDEPVMLRLVAAQLRSGDRNAASTTLGQFMARWPENVAAMRVGASMAADQKDWGTALRLWGAINDRIGPNDALVLAQMARANLELGDARAALPLAQRAYQLLPGNATISGVYGLALYRAGGNVQDARDLLFKAVQLAPTDGVLSGWRAEVRRAR
jgi:tetratricopeptide (TPR) repeat protein